jgi:hypothetical protein
VLAAGRRGPGLEVHLSMSLFKKSSSDPTTRQLCGRCRQRGGFLSKMTAIVADLFSYNAIVEEVWLCGPCRNQAANENAAALSRRTQPYLSRPKGGW